MKPATARAAAATARRSGPRGCHSPGSICSSQPTAPPPSTSAKASRGPICAAGIAVPAAQASMNMYAPGGPIRSALAAQVATIAIAAMVGTTAHGTPCTARPIATASAKASAIRASSRPRLR